MKKKWINSQLIEKESSFIVKGFLFLLIMTCFSITVRSQDTKVVKDFVVFDDKFVAGSPTGTMGAKEGVSLKADSNFTTAPFKGTSCLKISADGTEAWSGVYIQYLKGGKKKDSKNALADLSQYHYLVFYAKSDKDYTVAKMGMGEHGEFSKEETKVPLTKEWKRFVMELEPGNRTSINGLFLLVFEGAGTVFLDEIKYTEKNVPETGDVSYILRKTPLDSTAYYIYADKMINGAASGYMGSKNGSSIKFDESWNTNPYEGPKCIKVEVAKSEDWRGLHIQQTGKWNAGLTGKEPLPNLTKYKKLVFYARTDGENLSIPEIGVGTGEATEEKISDTFIDVGKTWKKYEVNIKGIELSKVNTLLFMVLPVGTFYLDEIRFVK